MLVEIGVLFSGVVARYVFHSPLVWSDELASILFLWLSMLGAVVVLRRGEHMRMTALVNGRSPQTRALLETFAIAASVAFLALVLARPSTTPPRSASSSRRRWRSATVGARRHPGLAWR